MCDENTLPAFQEEGEITVGIPLIMLLIFEKDRAYKGQSASAKPE